MIDAGDKSLCAKCFDQGSRDNKNEQLARMAEIYAAAELVVAAGGDDANVDRPLHDAISSDKVAQVGNIQILSYGSAYLGALRISMWATRAWTFQECYFARRRLFIIRDQARYKCNDGYSSPGLSDWFPFDGRNRRPKSGDTGSNERLLRIYLGCQLTYERDASAPVASALSFPFRGEIQRHIWAVPITFHTLDLPWYHPEPCERRLAFPSWFPTAWVGVIDGIGSCGIPENDLKPVDDAEGTFSRPLMNSNDPKQ